MAMPKKSVLPYPNKEQAIYGRIFNHREEVRAAVAVFVVTGNEDWRRGNWVVYNRIKSRNGGSLTIPT